MACVLFFSMLAQMFQCASINEDNAMLEHMQQREVYLQEQMARLQHEVEQGKVDRSWMDIPALLFPLLHSWKTWLWMGLLVLPLWILWQLQKWNQCDQREEEVESEHEEEEPVEQEEQETEEEKVEQEDEEEGEGDNDFCEFVDTRQITECVLAKVQGRDNRCQLVEEMMNDIVEAFTILCSDCFFPVLMPVVGVGSAFEGWSLPEEDTVYRLLVPMQAPRGHIFLPEVGTKGKALARNSRIRVELLCMCKVRKLVGDMLCFQHNPEDKLHKNQQPSLLQTLCTGSYLDVQKTVTWFNIQVPTVWTVTRHAHVYDLKVLPSSRSCKLLLKNTSSGEKLLAELLFGVQQGHSDIFLSSQNSEAGFTPSTVWPQSFAVAERRFFQYVARNAGPESCHLSCLRLFAHIQVGTGFSIDTIRTVYFRLLTTTNLKSWNRRNFTVRLENILHHLQCCLKDKHLHHFFLGNRKVPNEIVLPRNFHAARPLNLFQHLERDTNVYCQALSDFKVLRDLFRLQLL
ncbi:hypothetical protein ASZ78_001664 [Callipepla squamata]|uniref:Uncharacterized protein n=1 Tax=Callipepla squamata TaxID=9009 RepID=A0A226N906_CALSU|nr:hypothetical protein ASZ78_001664 [Callipepla squamata]